MASSEFQQAQAGSVTDLALTIRRALAQASRLAPEEAYFVAMTAAKDAQQSLASTDMSSAVAAANSHEDLGQSLDALPPPPDLTALDAIWRGVCLVEPTNSSALAICMGVLGSHVAAVVGSANVAHPCLQRCREVISLMQCHPATTRPMAENLADLLAQCSVGAHPTAWPAVSEREQKSPNVVATPESAPVQNGSSPDRPRLQPARAAPPLPNSTWPAVGERTAPHTPPPPNRSSAGSPGQPRHPVSPLRRRSSSNAPTDRALRVRSWLKTLRLHKYCNILEQMNYEDMVTLSEVDLEKLGITAKGARAKMLKSISGLKAANQQAEISIAKFNVDMRSGIFSDTFAGLTAMLEPDQAAYLYGPRSDAFDTAAEFMSTVKSLYMALVLGQSRHKPQHHDVRRFFSLLDKALRHEHFPVDDKKILFNWKLDCQRMLQRTGGDDGGNRGGGAGSNRPSPDSPWGSNAGSRSARAPGGPTPSKGKQQRNTGYDATSPTRGERAASFREQSITQLSPTARDRGNSFGSSQETRHSPAPGLLGDPSSWESKSEERLVQPPVPHSLDAFGFGPMAQIWGAGAAEAPATLDPIFTGIITPHTTSPAGGLHNPRPPGPPGDMRHLWEPRSDDNIAMGAGRPSPPVVTGDSDGAFVPQSEATAFVPGQSPQDGTGMDAAAAAWFGNGIATDANTLMQSIVMGASGKGLPDNKRSTAYF
eukprot:m.30584 g.30584  ORF g.30584 m.30584 type:complete len:708 (-) comp12247_c0_seq1:1496-3619(-)